MDYTAKTPIYVFGFIRSKCQICRRLAFVESIHDSGKEYRIFIPEGQGERRCRIPADNLDKISCCFDNPKHRQLTRYGNDNMVSFSADADEYAQLLAQNLFKDNDYTQKAIKSTSSSDFVRNCQRRIKTNNRLIDVLLDGEYTVVDRTPPKIKKKFQSQDT